MEVKKCYYSKEKGFKLQSYGIFGGFPQVDNSSIIYKNSDSKWVCELTYNYQKEIERYPEEENAKLLTDKEALRKLCNDVCQICDKQIHEFQEMKERVLFDLEVSYRKLEDGDNLENDS